MPEQQLRGWILSIPSEGDDVTSFEMQLTNRAGVVSNVTFTGTFDQNTTGEVQLQIATSAPASLNLRPGSRVFFRR